MSDNFRIDGVPSVPLFAEATWQPGVLKDALSAALLDTQNYLVRGAGDGQAANRERPAVDRDVLLGTSRSEFDPKGFLSHTLRQSESRAPCQNNVDLLRKFRGATPAHTPDPKYLPVPATMQPLVQKTMLLLNRLSPHLVQAVDRIVERLVLPGLEAADLTDPSPYGRFADIHCPPDSRSDLSCKENYAELAWKMLDQHPWGADMHLGSPDKPGSIGTYDVARLTGFSEEQAKRIAVACVGVDKNATHYPDPFQPGQPRRSESGDGGRAGDFHWHYNRSPAGQEDSRITAARVHMDRAVLLAQRGFYAQAEAELGIGLHSVQDMFSHAQISPFIHAVLGQYPDIVSYHRLAALEAVLATRAYLQLFAERVGLRPPSPPCPKIDEVNQSTPVTAMVGGDASAERRSELGPMLLAYPPGLLQFLQQRGVHIFVGKAGTTPASQGFGMDWDEDGQVTPDKWVDVNRDGICQPFEIEDAAPAGQSWDKQPAGYDHRQRLIFLSDELLADPALAAKVLRHEITHALDLLLCDDPELGPTWSTYRAGLLAAAQQQGRTGLQTDVVEFLAALHAVP